MTSLGRLFRSFVNLLRQPETPVPFEEQPLPITPPEGMPPEEELTEYATARRERHGPAPVYIMKLTKTYRFTEYISGDISKTYVPPDRAISYEAEIKMPDGTTREIAGMLRSGEQWTKERQTRRFASDLLRKDPNIANASNIVKEAIIKVNWYMNYWRPESELLPR